LLPRPLRLTRRQDFSAVYQRRRRFDTAGLTLYWKPRSSEAGTPRFGFVVSKKVAGKAHDRNLVKRRLREACRGLAERVACGDLVFVVRPAAVGSELSALEAEVMQLLTKAGVWGEA
jgi:ribonuclease P protein component